MNLEELLKKNRSYRRFDESYEIDPRTLKDLVALTRFSASARNSQSLKYIISWKKEKNMLIFPLLKWATAIKDWGGPKEGERPSGYIIIVNDSRISKDYFCDHGIAALTILLGATEKGLGGCIFASANKKTLASNLKLPDYFEILLVLAIGKPKETVVLELDKSPQPVPYWRDENGVHHVPKRSLEEIVIELK